MGARRLPPVTQLGAASLAFVAIGVIYLAAYLPKRAPLGPAVAFLCVAAAILAANALLLSRVRDFAWWRFFQVLGWGMLAYLVVSGMLEYTFLYDRTRGALLAIMSCDLLLFMTNVPLLMAFTVARHQAPERPAAA
jgi:hypothetical protein